MHYLKLSFEMFAEMVGTLIKTGVMNRLFSQFDFFSVQDRDCLSPRSAHLRKNRQKPARCGKRVDMFGDVKWDFEYARDEDDDRALRVARAILPSTQMIRYAAVLVECLIVGLLDRNDPQSTITKYSYSVFTTFSYCRTHL